MRAGEPVAFTEDDQGIQFPYNNAVVVSLNIRNYDIRRILIDNENSTNVLYFDVLLKWEYPLIGLKEYTPHRSALLGIQFKWKEPLPCP